MKVLISLKKRKYNNNNDPKLWNGSVCAAVLVLKGQTNIFGYIYFFNCKLSSGGTTVRWFVYVFDLNHACYLKQ